MFLFWHYSLYVIVNAYYYIFVKGVLSQVRDKKFGDFRNGLLT